MDRVVRVATWIVVALWSLVAWGSYALVNGASAFLARHADTITSGDPDLTVAFAWIVGLVGSIGLLAIAAIWAVVAALLLIVGQVIAAAVAPPRYRGALPPPPEALWPVDWRTDPAAGDRRDRGPPPPG